MVVPVELITRGCGAFVEAEDELGSPLAVDGRPIDGVDYGRKEHIMFGRPPSSTANGTSYGASSKPPVSTVTIICREDPISVNE